MSKSIMFGDAITMSSSSAVFSMLLQRENVHVPLLLKMGIGGVLAASTFWVQNQIKTSEQSTQINEKTKTLGAATIASSTGIVYALSKFTKRDFRPHLLEIAINVGGSYVMGLVVHRAVLPVLEFLGTFLSASLGKYSESKKEQTIF